MIRTKSCPLPGNWTTSSSCALTSFPLRGRTLARQKRPTLILSCLTKPALSQIAVPRRRALMNTPPYANQGLFPRTRACRRRHPDGLGQKSSACVGPIFNAVWISVCDNSTHRMTTLMLSSSDAGKVSVLWSRFSDDPELKQNTKIVCNTNLQTEFQLTSFWKSREYFNKYCNSGT
jgi:hypothetical protein